MASKFDSLNPGDPVYCLICENYPEIEVRSVAFSGTRTSKTGEVVVEVRVTMRSGPPFWTEAPAEIIHLTEKDAEKALFLENLRIKHR